MLIVGIDPGKTGGVVSLRLDYDENIEISRIIVMPEIYAFADHMEDIATHNAKKIKVYIERAQAMPKNGAVSMFKYGQHFGELLGVLTALQIPFETVPPITWTKAIHQTTNKSTPPKARSLQAVQRLFPGVRLTDPESERAKKPHEGIVDALLIAEYGRRQWMKS